MFTQPLRFHTLRRVLAFGHVFIFGYRWFSVSGRRLHLRHAGAVAPVVDHAGDLHAHPYKPPDEFNQQARRGSELLQYNLCKAIHENPPERLIFPQSMMRILA